MVENLNVRGSRIDMQLKYLVAEFDVLNMGEEAKILMRKKIPFSGDPKGNFFFFELSRSLTYLCPFMLLELNTE